jgi:hypothetical protein
MFFFVIFCFRFRMIHRAHWGCPKRWFKCRYFLNYGGSRVQVGHRESITHHHFGGNKWILFMKYGEYQGHHTFDIFGFFFFSVSVSLLVSVLQISDVFCRRVISIFEVSTSTYGKVYRYLLSLSQWRRRDVVLARPPRRVGGLGG